ncbi:MAG: ABC transporter permease [Candidatus Kapabacteria bacterium]|nr:ABC transporter permease [Candidatus Kapabacteria bacterium]
MSLSSIRFISEKISGSSKRQRFLNFTMTVSLLSVMLGCMALIISLAILDGFDKTLHESAVKFTSHITITSFNREPLPDYKKTLISLSENFQQIKSVEPICEREGLIKSSNLTEGVTIRGIFPEYNVSGLKSFIVDGTFEFTDSNAKEIIIGKRLADKLDVNINDEIALLTMKTRTLFGLPEPKVEKFKIHAIYNSGMVQYDDVLVFIPYQKGLSLFDMPVGSASNYQIMLNDMMESPILVDTIESFLRYPHFGLTVFNYHGSIFSWIEIQKEPIPIVLGLISIVAVLNIITSLLITIVEKTNTIGILRALGLNNRKILGIFIYKGFSIGIKGTFLGLLSAYAFCFLQAKYGFIRLKGEIYFLDVLPVEIVADHYIIVAGISLILTVTATLIPAFIATKITPLKAIQFK